MLQNLVGDFFFLSLKKNNKAAILRATLQKGISVSVYSAAKQTGS